MNPVVEDLRVTVTEMTTVAASATALIEGFGAKLEAAIAAALENGATAEQLEPLKALEDALEAESGKLAAAVAANTGVK